MKKKHNVEKERCKMKKEKNGYVQDIIEICLMRQLLGVICISIYCVTDEL